MNDQTATVTAAPGPRPGATIVAVCVAITVLAGAAGATGVLPPAALMGPLAGGLVLGAWHRTLLRWRTLTALIVLVLLLIPIRRYVFPGHLPIQLEPYRVLVLLVSIGWLASLAADPATRARRTGLEGPLIAVALAAIGSLAVNVGAVHALGVGSDVVKKLTFFASFFLVMYLITSVTNRRVDIDMLVKVLVGASAFVAFWTIIESRIGFNPFDHLSHVFPGLQFDAQGVPDQFGNDRGGHARAYASAQHPIALGAALVMVLPLAVYLARRKDTSTRLWAFAIALLGIASLATLSRTAVIMLATEVVVLMMLKREARRMWPLLFPFLIVVHIALPGTIGALKSAFLPTGGIVQEQRTGAGTYGSGRIADLGPGLQEWSRKPFLGQGFATRITDRSEPHVNAPILDNQWLGFLLETGAAGMLALLWLFTRAVRAMTRQARGDPTERSWLAAGLAAAILAYAIGMATYDAFSFIQVTLLMFVLLGIAAAERHAAGVPEALNFGAEKQRLRSSRALAGPAHGHQAV